MGDTIREVVRSLLDKEIRLVELEYRPYLSKSNRKRRDAVQNHNGPA